ACGAGGRQPAGRRNRQRLARGRGGAGMTASPIRVVLADDQRGVREGLTMLGGLIDGVEGGGAAGDGIEAVESATRDRPDVVLMDLRMPGMEGADATRRI